MKTKLLGLVGAGVLLTSFVRLGCAEEVELPTAFVAPFSADLTAIQYWQPALGSGLAEMLVTELGKISKFTMLENSQLDALKGEIKLGQDGWVDANQAVDKGGFAAADFMFTAKVTKFGHKESKIGLGGFIPGNLGNLGVKTTTSDVRIDWRLVDAANRKVIKTGSSSATEKGTGFNVGVNVGGSGGAIGFDNKEFMDSALGKATVKALDQIIAEVKPVTLPESGRKKAKAAVASKEAAAVTAAADALKKTPGKVLAAVGKDAVIITLGSKNGFKVGDKLDLYETVDTKDDKGTVVFTEEKLIGEITLQSVQEEKSKASYGGAVPAQAGWVVKAK